MFGIDDAVMMGAASAVGGLIQRADARQSQSIANDFSANQFATRYQTTVKDMEAAGLSPMLAYGQGGGSPPTGATFQAQNPFQGVASAYSSGATAEAQRENLQASAQSSRSSAWESQSRTELVQQQTKKIVAELESQLPKAEADLKRAGVTHVDAQVVQLTALAQMLKSQTDLNREKGLSEQQTRNVQYETIAKLQEETKLLEFDVSAASSMGNAARNMGQLKPFFDLLMSAVREARR